MFFVFMYSGKYKIYIVLNIILRIFLIFFGLDERNLNVKICVNLIDVVFRIWKVI